MTTPLKRPTGQQLSRAVADSREMRQDTIHTYLHYHWSLRMCCVDCPRITEWTPPELERRFAGRLDLSIADIAARIVCKPPEGCGSRDVALYPEPYVETDEGAQRAS